MPVLQYNSAQMPAWSEVKKIEVLSLKPGEEKSLLLKEKKEDFFVAAGQCSISWRENTADARTGDRLCLQWSDKEIVFRNPSAGTQIVRIAGDWGAECGEAGLFTLTQSEFPRNEGDPVSYTRTAEFDNHYHDCDEFWVILQGRGRVVTEGVMYDVGSGDCVITHMGDHHDFPQIFEPVRGIYFETTLKGKKRLGHLWEYRDG